MNNKECPVCLEEFNKNTFKILTPCNHLYCLNCFINLYDTRCPLCRMNFKDKLPNKMIDLIQKNTKNEVPNNVLNIHNRIDFPPLGD